MSEPRSLLNKLQVQSGYRLWLVNVPRDIAEELSAGAEVELVSGGEPHDGVLAFFVSSEEVKVLIDRILEGMAETGLVWVAYRKGTAGRASGLSRDVGWEPLAEAGWRPVRQIAIDAEWSALRFRPKHLVKAKPGSQFA